MRIKFESNHILGRLSYFIGNLYYSKGDISRAEPFIRYAAKKVPLHAFANFRLGMCRFKSEDWESALKHMEQALQLDPKRLNWIETRDRCLRKLGQLSPLSLAQQEKDVLKQLESNPVSNELLDKYARILLKQRKWWLVIEVTRDLLALDNSRSDWHFQLGTALEAMGRYDEAIVAFQDTLNRTPGNWKAAFYLGYCLERSSLQNHEANAIANAYQSAVANTNVSKAKKYGVGAIFAKLGFWDEAVVYFEKAVKENPTDSGLWYELCIALCNCHDWERAQSAANSCLACDPFLAHGHGRLGLIYEKLGYFKRSATAYSHAAHLDTKSSRKWLFRAGMSLLTSGRYKDASSTFLSMYSTEIIGLNSNSAEYFSSILGSNSFKNYNQKRLYYKNLALVNEATDNWNAAADAYLQILLGESRHDPELQYATGRALHKAGRYQEACYAFRSIELIGDNPGNFNSHKLNKDVNTHRTFVYNDLREGLPINESIIFYESFHGSSLSCNPHAIFKKLIADKKYSNFIHVWVVNDQDLISADYLKLDNVHFVKRHSYGYLKNLATAKYLVNNVTFPEYFVRREQQIYLNTWHGTPIKYLGKDVEKPFFSHRNIARNFLQATHILSSNEHTSNVLIDRYDLSSIITAKVSNTGYPRIDLTINLSETEKSAIRSQLGIGHDEKVILYAPTWRGTQGKSKFDRQHLLEDLKELRKTGHRILFKGHHLVESMIEDAVPTDLFAPHDIDVNTLMAAVDMLITDYSSIAIDYLVTRKPIVFYTYDEDSYKLERGLYFSPIEISDSVCSCRYNLAATIKNAFKNYNYDLHRDATNRFCPNEDGNATQRVIDLILSSNTKESNHSKYTKKKLAFYAGPLLPNGITSSFLNLLKCLDYEKYSVTVAVDPQSVEANTDKVRQIMQINSQIQFIAYTGQIALSLEESWVNDKYQHRRKLSSANMWNILEKGYTREYQRIFGQSEFDVFINFEGYNRKWTNIISFASRVQTGRKVIYLHNDMQEECRKRMPYLECNFRTYHKNDSLVGVSAVISGLNADNLSEKYDIPRSNFLYSENLHDPEGILKRALEEIDKPAVRSLLTDASPAFLTMGRLSVEKGHEKLIYAFKRVVATRPAAKLFILGDGPLRQSLQKLVDTLDMSNNVILLGHCDNPFPYLKNCHCFVLPSDHEGQPMVLLEALILGKPIIATDIPGNRGALKSNPEFLVENSEDGLFNAMIGFSSERASIVQFDVTSYQKSAMQTFEAAVLGE